MVARRRRKLATACKPLGYTCELLPEQYVRERSGALIDLATAELMEAGQTSKTAPGRSGHSIPTGLSREPCQ